MSIDSTSIIFTTRCRIIPDERLGLYFVDSVCTGDVISQYIWAFANMREEGSARHATGNGKNGQLSVACLPANYKGSNAASRCE